LMKNATSESLKLARKKSAVREWIESIAVAFLLAMVIREIGRAHV
jgi:hypothetical protein